MITQDEMQIAAIDIIQSIMDNPELYEHIPNNTRFTAVDQTVDTWIVEAGNERLIFNKRK